MKANDATKPFGMKDKLGYMFGDFGNDFFFNLIGSFLTVYYTNVLGISGAIVGTLFLVARCVDAFTDIGMGRLVDNAVAGPEGRYRPWIRRMRLPVVLAGVLVFVPWVANFPYGLKLVYIFVTYILWGSFCYTGINIPYGSMASVMTDDPVGRSSLSTFRSVGASLAGVIVGYITPQIIYVQDEAGNQVLVGERMFIVACVFAVLAFICYTFCYNWSTERIIVETKKKEEKKEKASGNLAANLLKNRALVALIAAALALLLAMMLAGTMNVYLYQDYFKNKNAMSFANLLNTGCTLLLAPFAGKFAKKFGKKESSSVALLIASATYAVLFFAKLTNPWAFCGTLVIANLGSGMFNLMCWAFVSDVIDYQTYKTGSTDGGTIYGVYSFSRKLGQALAGGLGGFVLTAIGYQSSVAGQVVVQSDKVTSSIYAVATGVPAVAYLLIALIMMFWYPLSKKKMEEVKKALDAR